MAISFSEIRTTVRSLTRSRAFSIVTVLTLGVAIGANTAIYSVVDAVLLRPLPYPESDRIVTVRLDVSGETVSELPFSDRGFWHFVENNRSFERFGGFTETRWALAGEGEPIEVSVGFMTIGAFEAIGVAPARGRFPSAEEDVPNGPLVALVSDQLWRNQFGGEDIIGRTIELNGNLAEVIGVMPAGYAFPSNETDVWLPYRLNRASQNFGGHHIGGVGRIGPGSDLEGAIRDAESLIARFDEAGYGPEWMSEVFTGRAIVRTIREVLVGESRRPLLIILGMVGFVLLIACGNVANLMLLRTESRVRESAVRSALGSSRWRLVRGVIAESLLLAAAGGVLGILLAFIGTRVLVAMAPPSIPRLDEIGMSGSVLLFTLAVTVGAGLLFGLFPAVRIARRNPIDALRDGGRGATIGRDRHAVRKTLVVMQIVLALVLLVGSGLMVRSFQQIRSIDPGFQPESVITFGLSLPGSRYPGPEPAARFYDDLLARLRGLPGVVEAGGITALPLTGGGAVLTTRLEEFPIGPGEFPPAYPVRRVTPGYFEALSIPLVEGRTFESRDHAERLGTVIISASLKNRYWQTGSALGKRLSPTQSMADVVGVVGDVRDAGLEAPPDPTIYLPMLDSVGGGTASMNIAVRTAVDPTSVLAAIRNEVRSLDSGLPLTNVRTMSEIVDESMSRLTFTMWLLVLGAFVALFLGSVGIYGVISYVVRQRTAEMGIRQALGATPGEIRGLVLRQGLLLSSVGVAIGLGAAAALGRFLTSLLYGISPFDPTTFVGGAVVFIGVAVLASLIPALRAGRIQPAVALRED